MMIANSSKEFIEKVEKAERVVLNSEMGQNLTNQLLKMKLEDNPNMTMEEWQQTKCELMTYLFAQFVRNTPEAMEELASHVYDECIR